jgi:hypothetical protein
MTKIWNGLNTKLVVIEGGEDSSVLKLNKYEGNIHQYKGEISLGDTPTVEEIKSLIEEFRVGNIEIDDDSDIKV